MSVTPENKYQHLILDWNFVKFLESDVYRAFKRVYLGIRTFDIFRPHIYRKITEIERIMNAHFLQETIAQVFLFFSGVFLLEKTVLSGAKSDFRSKLITWEWTPSNTYPEHPEQKGTTAFFQHMRMGDFTCHPHSLILLATRWSLRKHFQVNVSIFVI